MINLAYLSEEDTYVIHEEVINNFRTLKSDHIFKKVVDLENYASAVKAYLQWYLDFCAKALAGRIFSDDELVPVIFNTEPTEIEGEERESNILMHIFISGKYVKDLLKHINQENVTRHNATLMSLDVDLEELAIYYLIYIEKSQTKISANTIRRPFLSSSDILSATRDIFFIETLAGIEDLYLRDLKPVIMFQVRQLLETFGKEILGFAYIENNKGLVKTHTNIAWTFMNKELKETGSRIEFSFNHLHYDYLIKWSNSFIHTTFIHNSYIQFYALELLKELFKVSSDYLLTVDGNKKTLNAVVKINQYNALKRDFEKFVEDKVGHPPITVHWLAKNVHSYIISL